MMRELTQSLKMMVAFTCVMSLHLRATLYSQLSSLEVDLVEEGLAVFELVPEENPENRVVHQIHILTISPFTEDSGFLTIFNRLHINSREDIVRREVKQQQGELYDAAAVRDSELALRDQSLVRSTAVIVPVHSKSSQNPDDIDLLVVTRDLLSLRPTFAFKGSIDLITNLMIALGEHNFLGYNKSIAGIYEMQQGQHMWSLNYFDPRLFGSPLQLTVKPSLVLLRDSLKYDGMLGDLKIEKPLLYESDFFGYGAELTYGTRSVIDFNGSKVRTLDVPTSKGIERIERKYRWRNGKGSLHTKFSFGRTYKKELLVRYGFNIKRPSILGDVALDEEKRAYILEHLLPKNEFESFVTLGFGYFQNQYLTLYDYENFKLQETKRIGPSIAVTNDFSSKAVLLSDNNFLRPETKLTYTQPLYKDSFVYASISTSNRFDGGFTDNIFKYGVSLISPTIMGAGRFVLDGRLSTTSENRDNQKFVLGSDSGIRGVESRFYSGDKGFRTNLEFRMSPFDVWIFHIGGVVFYDVGSAFDDWRRANATHAVGLGLRFLAPQISSVLFRIDFGFPIFGKGKDYHVIVPSFGTGQAF